MGQAKPPIQPVASLGFELLARKGFARPAMRSPLAQGPPADERAVAISDDLGWNDLGDDAPPPVLTIEQSAKRQEAMARLICVPPGSRRPRGTALDAGRRAAFTLRLDAPRHVALRLACSLTNQSAQNFLIGALDQILGDMPEVAALAAQLPPRPRQSGTKP